MPVSAHPVRTVLWVLLVGVNLAGLASFFRERRFDPVPPSQVMVVRPSASHEAAQSVPVATEVHGAPEERVLVLVHSAFHTRLAGYLGVANLLLLAGLGWLAFRNPSVTITRVEPEGETLP